MLLRSFRCFTWTLHACLRRLYFISPLILTRTAAGAVARDAPAATLDGSELRKLYKAEREREFEEFFRTSPLRKQVEARLLAWHWRLGRDPEWKPTGMLSSGGLAFGACTREVMGRV
jgi:hypothetical protein